MAIAAIIEPTNPSHSLYGEVSGIPLSKFSRMASPLTSAASCVRGSVCGRKWWRHCWALDGRGENRESVAFRSQTRPQLGPASDKPRIPSLGPGSCWTGSPAANFQALFVDTIVSGSVRWSDMKIDLKYESYTDLSPQHITALRNLINALMKSVGEHGEFRIELGGSLYYGTYMVTGEMVEVRVTPLKQGLRKSRSTAKPQTSRRWSSATMLLPENCE